MTKQPSGAKALLERDRLEGAFRDAIGRVIARVELYDEAYTDTYRELRMRELLERCRELRTAFMAFESACSADSGASR